MSRHDERATNVFTVLTRYSGEAQDEELLKVGVFATVPQIYFGFIIENHYRGFLEFIIFPNCKGFHFI